MKTPDQEIETVNLQLKTGARMLRINSKVPVTDITMLDVVPSLHKLCDNVVSAASEVVQRQGKEVSCKAGCGSCCCQLVPVSDVELAYISKHLDSFPDERVKELEKRFVSAMEVLQEQGLTTRLDKHIRDRAGESSAELGEAYFNAGVYCPFLENSSCSIYEVRPSICRQFLVTSDAKYCKTLDKENINSVGIKPSVAKLMMHFYDGDEQEVPDWQPLIYFMRWREQNQNRVYTLHSGPKLLQRLYHALERSNPNDESKSSTGLDAAE